jgi:hypothetical protein
MLRRREAAASVGVYGETAVEVRTPPAPRSAPPRNRSILAAGLATAVLAAVWAAYPAADLRERDELLSEARGLGLPDRMADLPRTVPEGLNAAVELNEAIRLSERDSRVALALREFDGWPAETPPKPTDMARVAAAFAPVRAWIERATEKPDLQFSRRWSMETIYPEYRALDRFGYVLVAEATDLSGRGRPDEAVRRLRTAARLVDLTAREPTLYARLVAARQGENVLRGLQIALTDHARRPGFVAQARGVLGDLGAPVEGKSSWRAEWAFQREAVDALVSGREKLDLVPEAANANNLADVSPVQMAQNWVAARAFFLPRVRVGMEVALLRSQLERYKGLSVDPTASRAGDDRAPSPAEWRNLLVRTLESPSMAPVFARAAARRRVVATLLDALSSSAPPTLPADPLAPGRRLGFEAKNGRVRVWSVGTDGKDGGGTLSQNTHDGDVTAFYPYDDAAVRRATKEAAKRAERTVGISGPFY